MYRGCLEQNSGTEDTYRGRKGMGMGRYKELLGLKGDFEWDNGFRNQQLLLDSAHNRELVVILVVCLSFCLSIHLPNYLSIMFMYFLIFSIPCDTGQYKLFSILHCFAFPTTFSLPCLALGFSQNACNFYAFVFALYSFCFSFLLFLFSSNVAFFLFKH